MVLPDEDGPNSLLKSTLIVRTFPSTFISTFFMVSHVFAELIGLTEIRIRTRLGGGLS